MGQNISNLTNYEVAEKVKSLGEEFEASEAKIIENGVHGNMLLSDVASISVIFDLIGVDNQVNRRLIQNLFAKMAKGISDSKIKLGGSNSVEHLHSSRSVPVSASSSTELLISTSALQRMTEFGSGKTTIKIDRGTDANRDFLSSKAYSRDVHLFSHENERDHQKWNFIRVAGSKKGDNCYTIQLCDLIKYPGLRSYLGIIYLVVLTVLWICTILMTTPVASSGTWIALAYCP